MIAVRTASADETRAVAEALAALVGPGDVVLLSGDLGAGKTTFTQGLGRGLGIEARITSPTFTLAREYSGRVMLHHLDVYRLEQLAEVLDLGLPELLDSGGVVVVEWGDSIRPVLPADFLEVRLLFVDDGSDDERVFEFRGVGSSWSARGRALAGALSSWTEGEPC
ncbi:MAG: tRNA (adenosine(37)-N6)-threonylcarbamoyltransferase complex ATPase subunit type 1 TsaE [Acidimicrobiales bacterium]